MATRAQRALLLVGGGAGIGYGLYFTTQKKEIETLAHEKKSIESLVITESQRLSSLGKSVEEFEAKEKQLLAASTAKSKTLSEIQSKLEEARTLVGTLEKEASEKVVEQKKAQTELGATRSKLAELLSQTERTRDSLSLSEKSLEIAKQKVDVARLLLNPLNHPKIKKVLNK